MKKNIFNYLAALFLIAACQKEVNFETNLPAKGSLQDDITGNCLPKTVNGNYQTGTALSIGSNTISAQVNVSQPGTYTITTDTVNGYSFRTTGTFNVPGAANIILRGNGTPLTAGTDNFTVKFDTSICSVAVTVGSGATTPAVFTLGGAGGSCTSAIIAGTYATGTTLNSTNKVTINVNVTTVGSYNITTTYQGMTFAGSGIFTTTGANSVVLTGSGIPTSGGPNTVPITVGATTCSFVVNVTSPAVFTIDCSGAVVNGTYQANTALSSANTVSIPINTTTAGAYSISTTAVNGMVFSGSGTVTAGAGSIILTGNGTPVSTGTSTIPVSFGSSSCSFPVSVSGGAPTVNWKFTQGSTTYQGSTSSTMTTSIPGYFGFFLNGDNSAGDMFLLSLGDLSGTINAGETYSTGTTLSNSSVFQFLKGSTLNTWDANPNTLPAVVTTTVTSHNMITKTISGTFSGTAKDGGGNTVTITNGTFSATYQ